MLGIVWVEALVDEVAPAEWPVVCVHGWLTAWLAVSVLAVGAHAARITGEDGRPEPGLVPLAVASLPCAAASLLCLALVVVAPSAAQTVGRAAGYGAHPVSPAPGHQPAFRSGVQSAPRVTSSPELVTMPSSPYPVPTWGWWA